MRSYYNQGKLSPSAATVLSAILLFIFSGCASKPISPFNGDYSTRIENKEMFNNLKGEPLSDKYSQTEAIKILYDLTNEKLYFIASSKYNFHYDFAVSVLGAYYSLEDFNNVTYGYGANRKYLAATLDYFKSADVYALEYAGSDFSTPEEIKFLFSKIKENTFFGNELKLFINTSHLIELEHNHILNLPVINSGDVFKNQTYQPINGGITYGYLKKIYQLKNAIDSIGEHDIILINDNPLDLPITAGIITTQLQTPLSHINILTRNRGTVCMVNTLAWNDTLIKRLENKLIKLTVDEGNYIIEEALIKDALKFWNSKPAAKEIKLNGDIEKQHIINIISISKNSDYVVGTKAANFGELNKISVKSNYKTPEGAFAIPFYYYYNHIHQPAIDSLIKTLFADTAIQNNNSSLDDHLKKIRKAIKNAPIDNKLITEIETKIESNNSGNVYRFRSSTNAEDLQGFNGAGLYDSKTGILGDSIKSIEKAVKDVWASAFTYRAYVERKLFNIYEPTVSMGILVHRSFPDEEANGVALTKNLYRSDFPGFVINVQIGEISVVSPGDNIICDQFLVYNTRELGDIHEKVVADYITFSNQNNGQPVLSNNQIEELYRALQEINWHFYAEDKSFRGNYDDYALDIEFKFERGILYIKQVRPY